MKQYIYTRHLPHFQPEEAVFFITYRLAGSIPIPVIEQMNEEYAIKKKNIFSMASSTEEKKSQLFVLRKIYFANFDGMLDKKLNEPYWLENDSIATVVAESLHFLAKNSIELWCFCIMPNHVHLLMSLKRDDLAVYRIMQQHKSFTAKQANRLLHRTGRFWQQESYDHVVRNKEFEKITSYMLNNPVKAGLVKQWEDWKWTYLNPVLT